MEQSKQHNKKSIELRSEKVRNIVGQIPSLLVRQGASIIGIVLLALLGISAFVPYRKTIPINATLHHTPQIVRINAPSGGIFLVDTTLQEVKANQIIGNLLCNNSLLPIKSKVAGQLIWNIHNNNSVQKKELLCVVIPQQIQNIYGECMIDATQKTMIEKGQKVILINNSGQTFKGQITKIYPNILEQRQFKVRIQFETIRTNETYLEGQVILFKNSLLGYFVKSFRF